MTIIIQDAFKPVNAWVGELTESLFIRFGANSARAHANSPICDCVGCKWNIMA
jgi:hypothetical protein